MLELIKTKPIIAILIAVVVVALIITAVIELRKPPTTPPLAEVEIINSFETNISSISIAPGTINISTAFRTVENFHEEVEILNYKSAPITDEFVTNINNSLGVSEIDRQKLEGAGEIIDSSNGLKNLNIYKDFGTFIYTDALQPDANTDYSFSSDINIQQYRSKSEEFIRSIGLNVSKYSLTSTQYLTYPGSEPRIINNLAAAGLIEFTFTAQDDGISIVDAKGPAEPNDIIIWIDKDFVIRKAVATTVGTTGEATARLKAKTFEEIKDSLNKGEAKLVYSSFGSDTKVLFTAVERAELMYYASGDRLIPVYVISARLISEKGEEGSGKLILKAF